MAPPVRSIDSRFFAVAHGRPNGVALRYLDLGVWRGMSYAELVAMVRRLAGGLRELGVGSGQRVAVATGRTPEVIAVKIAVLALGASFVPLDRSEPVARLCDFCRLATPTLLVSAVEEDGGRMGVRSVSPAQLATAAAYPGERVDADEAAPAYVMFTSGTTGVPNGVVVPHRGVVRLVDRPGFMRLDHTRVMLHMAPQHFDAATLEIWGPLLNGGTCVLFPDDQVPTTRALRDAIAANGVNCAWLTSSLFNRIVEQDAACLAGLEELAIGGEALSPRHVQRALQALPGTALINGYGPTENTTFTTCHRIVGERVDGIARIPIGVPVQGTEVAVVDASLHEVPRGAEGELVAFGDGLALGYLGDPQLTASRFVDVAVAGRAARRAYRTGDLVRQLADGSYDFLGRVDQQVKIDGHRIEPAEIEHRLRELSRIADCRVRALPLDGGRLRLVVWFTATGTVDHDGLRQALAERLPAWMVPHHFLQVDALPLLANGKLDAAALPLPLPSPPPRAPALRFQDATVKLVAEVWRSVLGRAIDDENLAFFAAGGSSLDAIQATEELSRRSGEPLAATFLFEHATIRQQAEALRGMRTAPRSARGAGRDRRAP